MMMWLNRWRGWMLGRRKFQENKRGQPRQPRRRRPAVVHVRGTPACRGVLAWSGPYRVLCVPAAGGGGCSARPDAAEPVVRHALALVRAFVAAGRDVMLLGEAYGGSVASRVAELLAADPAAAARVHVATFGAFYRPQLPRGVDIVHFLHPADAVVRQCAVPRPPWVLSGPDGLYEEATGTFWAKPAKVVSELQGRLVNASARNFRSIAYYWGDGGIHERRGDPRGVVAW